MSVPQPRGKRGHRPWKGVSEGRRASTLMMNADVDEPPATIFFPTEDRRLSWPEWLVVYQDGTPTVVTHLSADLA